MVHAFPSSHSAGLAHMRATQPVGAQRWLAAQRESSGACSHVVPTQRSFVQAMPSSHPAGHPVVENASVPESTPPSLRVSGATIALHPDTLQKKTTATNGEARMEYLLVLRGRR